MTAKVSFLDQPKPVRDPADHVSLSSLFNCQKTDGQYRPSHQKQQNQPEPVRPNSHQLLKETLERARRPPEAPPLSFDERRYRPNISKRQQA
ncbi:hypothetical protein, partial [Shinella sp. NM-101]|uniref:hypothetical protein n=1 Tax=Shinella sp. NM-101 TaxID=2744455 RepID=UPI001F2246F9